MKYAAILSFIFIMTGTTFGQEIKNKKPTLIFFYQPNISYMFDKYLYNTMPAYGYQTGFNIDFKITNRLYVCSGFSYKVEGFSDIFDCPVFQSPVLKGISNIEHTNNYKYISCPFIIKYYIINQNKILIGLNTGFSGDIFLNSSRIITMVFTNNSKSIAKDNSSFNQSLGGSKAKITGTIGLNFNYWLSDKFSILLQPNYDILLYPYHINTAISNRRFWNLGLRIGICYKL